MTTASSEGHRAPPIAILVNGPSSSGKSTLCRALQNRLTDLADGDPQAAFARVAFDDLVVLISDKLYPISFVELQGSDLSRLSSRASHDGRAAWEYVDESHAEGKHGASPRVRLVLNPHAQRLLKGVHRSWGAHLQLGTNLIIDHFIQDVEWYEDVIAVLRESRARIFTVGVHCSVTELERRESFRGDGKVEGRPLGLARRSDELCHAHPMVYDVTVQTDVESTDRSVDRIIAALSPVAPDSRRIGIVGIGNMGGAMASNLLARGWQVQVHDLDRTKVEALQHRGAIPCADAAAAATNVPITIVCVVDAGQCDDVLWGERSVHARQGGLAGHTVMLCPTIAPGDVERLAARLSQAGAATIDAPMSGGPQRAADGTMSLMVACEASVRASHSELINALSSRVFYLGERAGNGARMKLINNLLAGINLVGAAEVLAMAQRMNMDLGMVLDVIEQSSGQSWIGSDRMRRAIENDYAPRAHATLLRKDTALAVQAGREAGFEGPLGAATSEVFSRVIEQGWANLDDAVVFRLLTEWFESE